MSSAQVSLTPTPRTGAAWVRILVAAVAFAVVAYVGIAFVWNFSVDERVRAHGRCSPRSPSSWPSPPMPAVEYLQTGSLGLDLAPVRHAHHRADAHRHRPQHHPWPGRGRRRSRSPSTSTRSAPSWWARWRADPRRPDRAASPTSSGRYVMPPPFHSDHRGRLRHRGRGHRADGRHLRAHRLVPAAAATAPALSSSWAAASRSSWSASMLFYAYTRFYGDQGIVIFNPDNTDPLLHRAWAGSSSRPGRRPRSSASVALLFVRRDVTVAYVVRRGRHHRHRGGRSSARPSAPTCSAA